MYIILKFLFIYSFIYLSRAQDFFSLIAPFANGGGGGGSGNAFGGLLSSLGKVKPAGGDSSARAAAAAQTAQSLMSVFSNSGSGPGANNPFEQFLNLPLGSALAQPIPNAPLQSPAPRQPAPSNNRNTHQGQLHQQRPNTSLPPIQTLPLIVPRTPPPPARFTPSNGRGPATSGGDEEDFEYFDRQSDGPILAEPSQRAHAVRSYFSSQREAPPPPSPIRAAPSPPDIFTLLEPLAQKTRERVEARRRQASPGNVGLSYNQRSPSRSSSPIGRLTDNFGNNFFKMINELSEYSKVAVPAPQPGSISYGNSVGPSGTAALSTDIANDQQLNALSPEAREGALDILDANNLMRAFLRTMSDNPSNPLRPLPLMNDGTETGRNRPLMDQLFESDILLTSKQMKAIVLAEAERKGQVKRRVKRKVITGGVYRWPKQAPIPYTFRESDQKWRQLIREGLQLWERETCIRFRENALGKDRIEFIRGSGCYSSVGKTGGVQRISIGFGCEDKGIVSHEVGHSLGFWHEQSRPDRDKYIHLNKKYIAGGTEGNFAKRSDLEIDGMGLPYDLGSVMHYGPTAFTTDWDEVTIQTLDKKYQHTIGQRLKPSFIDVKQINRLYCFQTCVGTQVRCINGGYADPNDCNRCKCPPGLGGPDCSYVQKSDGLCGGELAATTAWQHLTHKGKQKCAWRISANGARIRFILDSVKYKCETTCHSYVEIKHNSDFQQIGFRACCDEKNMEVVSEQDEILILTRNDADHHSDGAFTLRYILDTGAPLPKPPPPAWIPGSENRAFRGVQGKSGVIEKFILNAIPRVRDPQRPVESVFSIMTDYFASSLLGAQRDQK